MKLVTTQWLAKLVLFKGSSKNLSKYIFAQANVDPTSQFFKDTVCPKSQHFACELYLHPVDFRITEPQSEIRGGQLGQRVPSPLVLHSGAFPG